MNIGQLHHRCIARGLDRLDAQMLLLHVLGRDIHDRAWLLAHDTDPMSNAAQTWLDKLAQRRLAGEPVAYLVGRKEFFGLDLQVDARVLVPRPETETLVTWALEVLAPRNAGFALDLGTGSGAIALALKHKLPSVQVTGLDSSVDALAVAHANAQRLQLQVAFRHGSWLEGISAHFDVIVANPPYIAAGDPHLSALSHEPQTALTSGIDGFDDIRTIITQAMACMLPGAWLLLEHGYNQAAGVRGLLCAAGFDAVQTRQDWSGRERCTGGQRSNQW